MANAVEILITGKDQFSPKAQKAQRSAKGLQGGMASLGKTVLGVGAGFIAAQASIAGVQKAFSSTIGAALKFERQMAQIRALTGATAEDTEFLSKAIKDMARELPKSASELGAGAYFILSSGIEDAADAVGVLEVAAKASTIGLGETEKVADALTTVLNAYGMEASNAGHVTDVMIEAVKQGKAEASAFAGVLGRVVPLASQMGISFEQVSANLATFTRLGVSAEEAATGLRAVMNALINPTEQTRDTMADLGLSVAGLRKQIKEEGLLAALDSMMTATGGNEEALSKLFPNIRALTSVLGTAGVQMEDYKNILSATENATGNLEEGFGIISETTQFKMQKALGDLNVTLMQLGEEGLPLVTATAAALTTTLEGLNAVINVLDFATDVTAWGKAAEDATKGFDVLGGGFSFTAERSRILSQELGNTGVAAQDTATRLEQLGMKAIAAGLDAADFGAVFEHEVGPTVTEVLQAIQQEADAARDALAGMFQVVTQEEAGAEAALASLKLEAGRLEAKTDDLTAAERARLELLNGELIPAQQDSLGLLRLEKDAVEKAALAQTNAGPSQLLWKKNVEDQADSVANLTRELNNVPTQIAAEIRVRLEAEGIASAQLITQLSRQAAQGFQHGGFIPPGVVTPAILHGGSKGEVVIPLDKVPTGVGGGSSLTIQINGVFAGDERTAMELANMIAPEIRRMMS